MLRHSLIVAALCLVSSTVVGQTEAERRRAHLPYVRAATDCTARSIANSEAAKRLAAVGRWSEAISSVFETCKPQYLQLISSHDRIYGSGGDDFFKGPYINDLPRALSTRLVPACPAEQNVRWHNCRGTFKFPSGATYVGEWRDNTLQGQGTYTWPDGEKYVGEFRDGKRNGKGTYTWPDGRKHVGEFRDGNGHGQGTYTWPSGATYVGAFRDGQRTGQGTYTFPDGRRYVGEFRDGNFHGQGTITLADGRKYVGEWRDDKFHGQGTYTWPNGEKHAGEFRDGNFHGQGTRTFPNGEKFVGEYRDDRPHGQGILYSASGSVVQTGIWSNGEFVRAATPPAVSVSPPVSAAPTPPAAPKSGSGSAFRIANGRFVTNHHVVNDCNSLKVAGSPGGRVVASDAIRDLAVVSLANDNGPIASIRTTRIQLNESITAAGFPLEGAFSGIAITNGTISRLSGLRGDTGEVQISAPVQQGNSGGPLLDTAGNVIGVVSSKLNALRVAGALGDIPQNVNFAINGSSLRAFLDAKTINYREVGSEPELTGVQVAARASAFTVLIECQG
jgi:hypothetical protein